MYTRSQRRHNDWRKALRKKKITERCYLMSPEHPWYDNLHQFSKNKVHCSCPMCRSKTNHPGSIGPAMNWPHRDVKQFVDMAQQMLEYYADAA